MASNGLEAAFQHNLHRRRFLFGKSRALPPPPPRASERSSSRSEPFNDKAPRKICYKERLIGVSLPARSVRWSASKTSFYTINICGTTRTRTKKNARPARVLFFEYLSGGGTLALAASPPAGSNDSYLVDPASSHMLVSKIKPCMSKYKQLYTVKLQMAH